MKNYNLKLKIILIIIFCFLLLTFNLETAEASAVSLGINPPLIKITAKPPATITAPISLKNMGKETAELVISLKPFEANAENGRISYLQNPNYPALFDQIRVNDGNEIINSLKLAPSQEKKLNLVINLPPRQTASDYYFSVVFTTTSNSQNNPNSSQNKLGIATNVLLSVNHQEQAEAEVVEFSAPFFQETGPVPFIIRVKNTGSHFITPQGEILIKNIFGRKIGRIQLLPVNILKDVTRRIPGTDLSKNEAGLTLSDAAWSEKNLFGPYSATLTLALSKQGPVIERTIYFVGFPIKLFLGFTLAIFIVILILNRLRLRRF